MKAKLGQRDATLYYEQIDYEAYEDRGESRQSQWIVNPTRGEKKTGQKP